MKVLHRNAPLAERILARGSATGFTGRLDCRQQQSDQDTDDCDDNEQLNQRECALRSSTKFHRKLKM
jgi:hypothetical protein